MAVQPCPLQGQRGRVRRVAREFIEVLSCAVEQLADDPAGHAVAVLKAGRVVDASGGHLDRVLKPLARQVAGAPGGPGADTRAQRQRRHCGGDPARGVSLAPLGLGLPLRQHGQRHRRQRGHQLEHRELQAVAFGPQVGGQGFALVGLPLAGRCDPALEQARVECALRLEFGVKALGQPFDQHREDALSTPGPLHLANFLAHPDRPRRGRTAKDDQRIRSLKRRAQRGAQVSAGIGVPAVAENRRQPLGHRAAPEVLAAQRRGHDVGLQGLLKRFSGAAVKA